MIGAIGGVQVDDQVRVPAAHEPDQCPRLRCGQLHVVAIEIEAIGILANANAADGAVLLDSIVGADFLVTVGVVVGDDEDDELGKERAQVAEQQALGEVEARLLPLNLPGVNVGHHQHNRLARLQRCTGSGDGRIGQDHERKRMTLDGLTHHFDANERAGLL